MRLVLAAIAALVLAGCASTPRIRGISEPGFEPGARATWAWQDVPRLTAAERYPRVDNSIVRGQLERGVGRALAERGYREATSMANAR